MSNKILELRRERATEIQKAQHILDIADERDGKMTEQEQRDYEAAMARIEELAHDIEAREKLEKLAQETAVSERRTQPEKPEQARIGMGAGDIRQYSITRAIRALADFQRGNHKALNEAALEMEASRAVADKLGVQPQGFYVPYDVLETRDLNVGTATAGGNLVATDLLAGSFIEMLRNRLILGRAGITILDGLVGDVAIPKQTGSATAYWVGEGGSPTESQQTIAQVSLTPHTVGAFTDYTRKLMKQSSLSVEQFVRNDLTAVLALAIDYAGLHGDSGTDANQPDGVETFADVTTVVGGTNGAAPDWADIVGLETAVSQDNADIAAMAYITNAKVRGKLKQTEKASGTAQFIWDGTTMNGYNALVSNQVRSDRSKGTGTNLSTIFFGVWSQLVMGMWGGLDILVDPYTGSTSGNIRVVALQDVDFASRHDEAFAAMLDAVTA